jgi:nucleotide-binding universal stress UspA family protein
MIVMGTKGASGLQEVLLGSNTAAVMERATCPVLAVPENSRFTPIKKIAFATDFRENDIEAINYLTSIAMLFGAGLVIVHVADPVVPQNYEAALLKVFQEEIKTRSRFKDISFEIIKGSNTVKVLNEFIKVNGIDMIAVSTRKKNFFTRFFDKSFTKQLAYHSVIPVMAFHQVDSY